MFALDLGVQGHELVVGLPEVLHVLGHAVVAGQLHLELGHDGGDLLEAGQRDLHGLEPLHVVGGVAPDAVPLVQHLVQLGLLLGCLLGNVVEEVLHLVHLRLVALHVRLELLVVDHEVLQGLHVAGKRGLADLDDLLLVSV